MIKTCKLQTCNELHTVELQDVLFSPDSKTIKRVSGETIISLPIDLDSISTRLSYLENIIHNNADENVYQEIEKELNEIAKYQDQLTVLNKYFPNNKIMEGIK